MRIDFHPSAEPTLGVEWELALVDRRTRDLRNDAAHLFARAKARLPDPGRLHKELLKNTVEIVTGVCSTTSEAMADLRRTLEVVVPAGDELGIDLFGAGTHPFASWTVQQLTEGHRYAELINRTQWWGRQMLIWGVHVHVGMPERVAGDAGAVVAAQPVPAPPGAVGLVADLGGGRHPVRLEPRADVPAAADGRAAVPVHARGRSSRRTSATRSPPA